MELTNVRHNFIQKYKECIWCLNNKKSLIPEIRSRNQQWQIENFILLLRVYPNPNLWKFKHRYVFRIEINDILHMWESTYVPLDIKTRVSDLRIRKRDWRWRIKNELNYSIVIKSAVIKYLNQSIVTNYLKLQ